MAAQVNIVKRAITDDDMVRRRSALFMARCALTEVRSGCATF